MYIFLNVIKKQTNQCSTATANVGLSCEMQMFYVLYMSQLCSTVLAAFTVACVAMAVVSDWQPYKEATM